MTPAFFWITVFSLILLPAFPVGIGIRLDDLLPFLWLGMACVGLVDFRLNAVVQWRLTFMVMLAFIIPISITYGTIVGFGGTASDFIQLIRLLMYAATYLLAVAYFSRTPDPDRALRRITTFGLILFGIAVAQYFNVLGLNERYVPIIAPTQFETLVNDYPTPRPVGMIGNPNELGFLFVILAIVAAYRYSTVGSRFALMLVPVFGLGIALTLSRAAMAAFVVAMGVVVVRSIFPTTIPRLAMRAFLACVTVAAAYALFFHTGIYDAITWRFVRAFETSADASWTQRVENWGENLAIIRDHFVIGVGPLRRVQFDHAADNEWLLMLRSYGLVGTLMLVGLLTIPTQMIHEKKARIAAWALVLAIFVYMIPASVFHSLALFPMVLIVFAGCGSRTATAAYRPSSGSWRR